MKNVRIDVFEAKSFLSRLKGLMFKKNVNYNLLIKKCNWIHTFFMRSFIDVLYLDKNNKVVKIQENIRPYRFLLPVWRASAVLELPPSYIKNNKVLVGDIINLNIKKII